MSNMENRASILLEVLIQRKALQERVHIKDVKKQLGYTDTQSKNFCGKNVEDYFRSLHILGIVLIDKTKVKKINTNESYSCLMYTKEEDTPVWKTGSSNSASEILRYACRRFSAEKLATATEIMKLLNMSVTFEQSRPMCGSNVDLALRRFEQLGLVLVDNKAKYRDAIVYMNPAWYSLMEIQDYKIKPKKRKVKKKTKKQKVRKEKKDVKTDKHTTPNTKPS